MLINGSGKVEHLTTGTTVLGVFDPLPFIEMGSVENLDEFTLFLFTDGLTETFDDKEEEFGTERLEEFLTDQYGNNLADTHKSLLEVLNKYRGKQSFSDDLTFLSCKVKNGTL